MPRDRRLYMTFPNDFWTHPKVSRLSDAAFRAFVEANGHSRMRESDGVIEEEDAHFMWKPEVLDELVKSHPTRPLLIREDDRYLLRDYAEHQLTKADREDLAAKRKAAGRASAERRRALAEHVLSKPEQTPTEREIERETEKEEDQTPLSPAVANDHGTLIPDDWRPNQGHIDKAVSLHLDVKNEYHRFRQSAVTKQRRLKNWNTGFTNWLRKAAEFNQQRQGVATVAPKKLSRVEENLAEYNRLYGGDTNGRTGSVPALDPGFGS